MATVRLYKCPNCGRVHFGITLDEAQAAVDRENVVLRELGMPAVATVDRYLGCFGCGVSSADFVVIQEHEVTVGATLQPVVILESPEKNSHPEVDRE